MANLQAARLQGGLQGASGGYVAAADRGGDDEDASGALRHTCDCTSGTRPRRAPAGPPGRWYHGRMRRLKALLPLLVAGLLGACAPDAQPTLHDVYLYGLDGGAARYGFFYGGPGSLRLDGTPVELTEGTVEDAPLAVSGSLLVDGQPYRMTTPDAIEPPVQVARIPLTTSLQVRADAEVGTVAYWDGSRWLTLLEPAAGAVDRRVAPRPRIGRLRGIGALTDAEAEAVADFLEARDGPLVVAELPEDSLSTRSIDGLTEYRATGLYVQAALEVDPAAYQAPAQQLAWEVMARGAQAVGYDTHAFRLVTNQDELLALWNQAHGSQLDVPPVPDVTFARETVLAIFQGQQPTGGHGIEVLDVVVDDAELFVNMRFLEPAPDAIVTQALTSPWVFVRVLRGNIGVTWFRNPETGELLGVARGE